MGKVYLGVDIGGTNIKAGVIDDKGSVLMTKSIKTRLGGAYQEVLLDIAQVVNSIKEIYGERLWTVVGYCCPGIIDTKNGVVVFANNLMWKAVPFVSFMKEQTQLDAVIDNDANMAAMGEYTFGAATQYQDSVMVTLGTGVGGGIILGGKLIDEGKYHVELGHMVVAHDGLACSCGRKGCFEVYCSATALIRETKQAMQDNSESEMWKIAKDLENVNGRTAFLCHKTDASAKKVIDQFIDMLADGLSNIINLFRPQVIILGGGVCNEGENLMKPLRALMNQRNCYANFGESVNIVVAKLGNQAGFIGAASLAMQHII